MPLGVARLRQSHVTGAQTGDLMTGAEYALLGAKASLTLIQIAQKQSFFKRLATFAKRPNYVLVLGSTGVGKSQFIESLTSAAAPAIDRMDRTQHDPEQTVILAKKKLTITDTPGQTAHRSVRTRAILRRMSKKSVGIVNVVAWGYHEYRTGSDEALDANGEAAERWLMSHRSVEIEALQEWALAAGNVSWVLTVVNKADLWWDERESVVDHYENGRYNKALVRNGARSTLVLEYSATRHPFYGSAPMSGTFSEDDRMERQQVVLRELIRSINEAGR